VRRRGCVVDEPPVHSCSAPRVQHPARGFAVTCEIGSAWQTVDPEAMSEARPPLQLSSVAPTLRLRRQCRPVQPRIAERCQQRRGDVLESNRRRREGCSPKCFSRRVPAGIRSRVRVLDKMREAHEAHAESTHTLQNTQPPQGREPAQLNTGTSSHPVPSVFSPSGRGGVVPDGDHAGSWPAPSLGEFSHPELAQAEAY